MDQCSSLHDKCPAAYPTLGHLLAYTSVHAAAVGAGMLGVSTAINGFTHTLLLMMLACPSHGFGLFDCLPLDMLLELHGAHVLVIRNIGCSLCILV